MKLSIEEMLSKEIANNFSYYLKKSPRFRRSSFPGNNATLRRIEENDRIIEHKNNGNKTSLITEGFIYSCQENLKCSKVDLIFGGEEKLEEMVEYLLESVSRVVLLPDLETKNSVYEEFIFNKYDSEFQRSLINLFSAFVEYNLKRYNFSNAGFGYPGMFIYDTSGLQNHYFDFYFDEIEIEEMEINEVEIEAISINLAKISRFLWEIMKSEVMESFTNRIINNLVIVDKKTNIKPIKFHNLNDSIEEWLKVDYANIIVPQYVKKLKKNAIFSMGYFANSIFDFRTSIARDYSKVDINQDITIDIVKEEYNEKADKLMEKRIERKEIKNLDLLDEIIEARNRNEEYKVRIPYWKGNNQNILNFLGKMNLSQIDILIERIYQIQNLYLETVSPGDEKNIL